MTDLHTGLLVLVLFSWVVSAVVFYAAERKTKKKMLDTKK